MERKEGERDWRIEWFPRAGNGSADAWAKVLEGVRPYLFAIANSELEPALQPKIGASDLVQQTLLEAQKAIGQYEWRSADELLAWLRRILLNNLADQRDRFRGRPGRAAGGEAAIDSSVKDRLSKKLTTGSAFALDKLIAAERIEMVQDAIAALSEEQRLALLARFRDGLSWTRIAERVGRSPEAARKLVFRAIEKIRDRLEPLHDSGSLRRA